MNYIIQKGNILFKEDNIVITPLGVPAIICEVINHGMEYVVNEMPILSEVEIQGILMGTIPANEKMEGASKRYKLEDLRCPTKEEMKNNIMTNLLQQGCTFPDLTIH